MKQILCSLVEKCPLLEIIKLDSDHELNIQGILDIKKQSSLLASASHLRKLELPVELNSNDIYGLATTRLIWINQTDCINLQNKMRLAPKGLCPA